jgi:hypothetical protein
MFSWSGCLTVEAVMPQFLIISIAIAIKSKKFMQDNVVPVRGMLDPDVQYNYIHSAASTLTSTNPVIWVCPVA